MNSQKIQHREVMKFILGGKSTFTLKNPRTLNRLTYNVNKHKNDDIYFAKVSSILVISDTLHLRASSLDKEMK